MIAVRLTLFGLGLAVLVGGAAMARFWRHSDRGFWFAGFMVALAAQMAANVALATRVILDWPHLAQAHVPLMFALGPFLYLHVRARLVTKPAAPISHFIVPALAFVVLLPFYLADAGTKQAFMLRALDSYPAAWRIRQTIFLAHTGAYIVAAIRLTGTVPIAPDSFVWSRGVAWLGMGVWAVAAVRFVVAYRPATAPVAMAASSIGLAAVVFGGLATSAATRLRPRARHRPADAAERKEEDACLRQTLHCLRDGQLIRRRDLTLETLAAAVGTTPHFLSRVVNERCGTTVPELLNQLRVEAARVLLEEREAARSINQIAEAVGFGSRSAFNAAFKRHTGMTPTAYRRRCANL